MPWYEPAARAPPAPRRRRDDAVANRASLEVYGGNVRADDDEGDDDDGAVVDVAGYVGEGWDYPHHSFDDGRDDGDGMTMDPFFDEFQSRVEGRLSTAFPRGDFAWAATADGARSRLPNSSFGHSCGADSNNFGDDRNERPNCGGDDDNGLMESAAARFFHPRPVAALAPYADLFSPMNGFPDGGGGGGRGGGEDGVEDARGRTGGERDCRRDDDDDGEGRPPSALGPRNLFDFGRYSAKKKEGERTTTTQAAARRGNRSQSKLERDSRTGEVVAVARSKSRSESDADAMHGDRQRATAAKTWGDYGGRSVNEGGGARGATAGGGEKSKQPKEGKKRKEGKKEDDNGKGEDIMKRRQTKRGTGGMDAFLARRGENSHEGGDNDEQGDDGNARREPAAAKSRKRRVQMDRSHANAGTELGIPAYDDEGGAQAPAGGRRRRHERTAAAVSRKDLEGIERADLRNAAQCAEGLEEFLTMLGRREYVAFTMIFLDPYTGNHPSVPVREDDDGEGGDVGGGGGGGVGRRGGKKKKRGGAAAGSGRSGKYALPTDNGGGGLECTTPFLPSSRKYCTPKGGDCTAWNCVCDTHVRADRGRAALLGAMFVIGEDEDGDGDDGTGCYLLPLGPTANSSSPDGDVDVPAEYRRMADWPVNEMTCDVSLDDRWRAFESILLNDGTKLVTYNATVSLLPFFFHLRSDAAGRNHSRGLGSSRYASCLAGTSDAQSQNDRVVRWVGYLSSVLDLRVMMWMLKPDAKDDMLEWAYFREGFPHLASSTAPTAKMPVILQGLVEAKANLEFIHSLHPKINEQIVNKRLMDALKFIESPVQSVLASMEDRGIGFQAKRMKSGEIKARIEGLEAEGQAITKNPDFLLSSPQQVSQYLFDVLKLSVPTGIISKTKAGSSHRSTSEETLVAIKAEMKSRLGSSPKIIDIILEFRMLNKLLTTFVVPYPNLSRRENASGKRTKNSPAVIRPQWCCTSTRTGRLSCRQPNLQQVPNDGALAINPRNAFVASEEGMCLFAADYSQKEVRILAHMSRDQTLLNLFQSDTAVDIYKQMASLIRNKPIDAVSASERAQFKQVTLAILYGMSPNQVAKKLSISPNSARKLMDDFFRRFAHIKKWMDETKANARRNSYVNTISGRRRYLDDINNLDDNAKKTEAERQAINTVIQGSAADLMKMAMLHLQKRLTVNWQGETDLTGTATRPKMLLSIHDEVILQCRLNMKDIKRLQAIAQSACCRELEESFGLRVPLLLKCSVGKSWGAMKELDQKHVP